MEYQFDDGGRAQAGFKGFAGDCGVRAITIALELDYKSTYEELAELNRAFWTKKAKYARIQRRKVIYTKRAVTSARQGLNREVVDEYLKKFDWHYFNLTTFGEPPARFSDLSPQGTFIVALRKHYVTVIDGVIHDTYDSSEAGMNEDRAIFGYYVKA